MLGGGGASSNNISSQQISDKEASQTTQNDLDDEIPF
jgi:hypothetical protein